MIFITAIHLSGGFEHPHIDRVMWLAAQEGTSGVASRQGIVDLIRQGHQLRVAGGHGPAVVGVVEGEDAYLRTYSDDEWTDNLLSLPRF